MKKPET